MKRSWTSLLIIVTLLLGACATEKTETTTPESAGTMVAELISTDLIEGDGEVAEMGSSIDVHYTLWFYDAEAEDGRGKRLQSSKDGGRSYPFTLGQSAVIPGWHEGIPGMKVAGTRELIIPHRLACAERGWGTDIPPNTDLIFEIDLLEIQ